MAQQDTSKYICEGLSMLNLDATSREHRAWLNMVKESKSIQLSLTIEFSDGHVSSVGGALGFDVFKHADEMASMAINGISIDMMTHGAPTKVKPIVIFHGAAGPIKPSKESEALVKRQYTVIVKEALVQVKAFFKMQSAETVVGKE